MANVTHFPSGTPAVPPHARIDDAMTDLLALTQALDAIVWYDGEKSSALFFLVEKLGETYRMLEALHQEERLEELQAHAKGVAA
jgi:hypothetical protein